MKYSIVEIERYFCIVEESTGLTIYKTMCCTKANLILKKLRRGSGFQGTTPQFFCSR